jgi:hypothetical protein
MVALLMWGNQPNPYYQVAQLVFQPIDLFADFIQVLEKENLSLLGQSNSLVMSFLKKKITKKFKKQSSDGF